MAVRLLAWDAPNMDMTLTKLLDGRPQPSQRPDLTVLHRWFVEGAGAGDHSEAAVFVNVPEHLADRMTGWVLYLCQTGFRVFAKPKIGPSDIDDEMAAYLTERPPSDVAEVVIASHDARAFLDVAERLAAAGVKVNVLGFREFAGQFVQSDAVRFVDAATVDDLFADLPQRVSLSDLPPEGRWFEPTAPVTTHVEPVDVDVSA